MSGRENAALAQAKLHDAISEMTTDDFLLLIGHPLNIAMAAHIAMTKLRKVSFLIWDRASYTYKTSEVES